jgi:hypothetical protein
MARYEDDYWDQRKGLPVRPIRRPSNLDPNYHDGEYHGERFDAGYEGQAPYGRHRMWRANDLGRYGGFDGRYDAGEGWVDEDGIWHDPFDERGTGREAGVRRPYGERDFYRSGGGVRRDMGYLKDFNAYSPALRGRHRYDRNFGYAEGSPGGPRRGHTPYDRDHFQNPENRYGGYNSAGFSEGWLPRQANRGSHANRKMS